MPLIALLKKIYHYLLAAFGAIIYGFPSRKVFVLGVTGTKGKSTVIELINAILEAAGKKTALVSSVRIKVAEDVIKNSTSMTMPGRFFLQKFLVKNVIVRICAFKVDRVDRITLLLQNSIKIF